MPTTVYQPQALTPIERARQIHDRAGREGRALTSSEKVEYDLAISKARDVSVGRNLAEDKPWVNLGEQLMAIREHAKTNGEKKDPRLFATAIGQNETVDAEGGFALAPQFASDLLTRTYQSGEVTSRCRQRPMSSPRLVLNGVDDANRVGGPLGAGILVMRTAEAQSVNISKLKFRRVEMNANKLMGFYAATDEILEDAPALQAELDDYFPEAFSWIGDNEVLNGTGSGQPLGINASGATVVTPWASTQSTLFTTQNALDMQSHLWLRSRANAAWFMGPDIEDALYSLTIPGPQGTAVALYTPPGVNGNNSPYGRMLNKPVIIIEQTAPAGYQGDVLLADMSQYVIGTRGGIKSASSIHVAFLTDQQVFRWTLRNDGSPLWDKPVTQNNSANKVSPFVTLAGGRQLLAA